VSKLNVIWADYGCEICDDYPMLLIEAGCYMDDSKSLFKSYVNNNNIEYVATWHQEGGKDFDKALGNNGYGNTKYWIKPDKSFTKTNASTISNSGIEKHVCGTPITNNLNKVKINTNISLYNLNKSGFSLKVSKADNYTISLYSVNGKLKNTLSKKLSAGSHQIHFNNARLANGIYLVESKNGQNISREKKILE
jgi:hypothetical protein